MVWFVFLMITCIALVIILVPLLRKQNNVLQRSEYDLSIYRDQLNEIEKEYSRLLLMPEQADTARAEIQRRILAAKDTENIVPLGRQSARSNFILLAVIVFGIPLSCLMTYGYLGSPYIKAAPYAQRVQDPDFIMTMDAEKLAVLLGKKPDMQGYQYLADMYFLLHRYDDAAGSYQKMIDMGADDAKVWSSLAQMITLAHDETVPLEAKEAFKKALQRNPHEERARFYLGVWEMENNEPRKAVAIWRDLEKDSAADAPWMITLRDHIAIISKKGGFVPETVAPMPALQVIK
jgi:cytochrome c-type biogenesis protein CcmH